MKWYFEICGGHTHVRVFMNGGKCGDLCFRNDEFEQIKSGLSHVTGLVTFIEEVKRMCAVHHSTACGCVRPK